MIVRMTKRPYIAYNSIMSHLKNYYYDYLVRFIAFTVPKDARILIIDQQEAVKNRGVSIPAGRYDYIVATDILGYVADVQSFLLQAKESLHDDGRIVITQYNVLWEPVLRLASHLRLRREIIEQNWLTRNDLKNFAHLAGLETVRSGAKMLVPVYIPIVSFIFNHFIANIWPFTHLGLIHYLIVRKPVPRLPAQAQKGGPSISIVVPARNEAGTIEKIARDLPRLGSSTEIIFVEGNSTDNTYDEIVRVSGLLGKTHNIKYCKQEGRGKGDAVRKGFDMATGDILAIYDADMTVPADELGKFYDALVGNKADFVNGSRLVYPLEKDSMRVLNFFGNKFFSLAFSWILGQPLKDTLCGTKVLWRADYDKIQRGRSFFGDFDPFGDFDLLFGAAKLNLKIVDLPIHYKERVYGETNISRWKHGWLLLKMTVFAARKMRFL